MLSKDASVMWNNYPILIICYEQIICQPTELKKLFKS